MKERGAAEHAAGAQNAQALQGYLHSVQSPYGDCWDIASVTASEDAAPLSLPPPTAPAVVVEVEEPGLAEQALHLHSIQTVARNAQLQLASLVNPEPARPPPAPT